MINKYYTVGKLSVVLVIGVLVIFSLLKFKSTPKYDLGTFKTANGWGYNVLINYRIYIHQEIIPAVYGNQSFKSVQDANKTGDLVIKKLRKGQLPTIRIEELDSLGLSYKK